ncbi:MAG: hypothetical protein ING44_06800 [Telmatospirillum sp.]|nr:hypothetical protein [Telmatospirillum sp.]
MSLSAIRQFAIDYVSLEDRLLLRLRTEGTADIYRLLITRRYLSLFWTALTGELHKSLAETKNAVARDFLLEMAETRATASANFSTPFEDPAAAKAAAAASAEGSANPIPDAHLLWAFHILRNPDGTTLLSLITWDRMRLDLTLADDGLFGLMKLLRDAARTAEWELPMEWGVNFPGAAHHAGETRRLN